MDAALFDPDSRPALAHELLVDVWGCAAAPLAEAGVVRALCDGLVERLGVVVLQVPQVHRFEDTARGPGGVTALYLLSESHLAVHTWPERGALLLSLCCCRPLFDDAVVREVIARYLGAAQLRLVRHERGTS